MNGQIVPSVGNQLVGFPGGQGLGLVPGQGLLSGFAPGARAVVQRTTTTVTSSRGPSAPPLTQFATLREMALQLGQDRITGAQETANANELARKAEQEAHQLKLLLEAAKTKARNDSLRS
jgi:hypothetical protein